MDHVVTVEGGSGRHLWLVCSCSGVELASWRGRNVPLSELADVAHEHITDVERAATPSQG